MDLREIVLEIHSSEEIWQLIDKAVPVVFIHRFRPNEVLEWWKADLKTQHGVELKNATVRQLEFDLQTDLEGLREIIGLNTRFLSFYQFDKPVPGTLIPDQLPESNKNKILRQNGLRHYFHVSFEFLTIGSFDPEFLRSIEENPAFQEYLNRRKDA